MFEKVAEADFVRGEHQVLKFWTERQIFQKLRRKNAGKPKWSFLDGPITANNPMGVHHAWGRTYKDTYQRYFAMTGHELRYQNGFDCQGLWVEVEVEKELGFTTKNSIVEHGIDHFVNACKQRVLKFAARQTEQSIRLGYWMDWDNPDELRKLSEAVGTEKPVTYVPANGQPETGLAHQLVGQLGNPAWGGSYFTFSTENNETIWTFLKKCFDRGKIYRGHDVMPWSGHGGSAYSQMEVADGRKLTTHKSIFVRFPIVGRGSRDKGQGPESVGSAVRTNSESPENEFLLVWTTTPWTLTSNVAAAVNPELTYVKLRTKRDNAVYYFAKDNLEYKRLDKEFKEGFGRPEWQWPQGTPKLKTLAQIFKEQGGFEIEAELKGADMIGWQYRGPFDDLEAQSVLRERNIDSKKLWHFDSPAWHYSGLLTTGPISSNRDFLLAAAKIANHVFYDRIDDARLSNLILNPIPSGPGSLGGLSTQDLSTVQILRELSITPKAGSALSQFTLLVDLDTKITNEVAFQDVAQSIFPELSEMDANYLSDKSYKRFGKLMETANKELLTALHVAHELKSAIDCHTVIDGGRDSKGNPNVTAGEGTGIVHIAPGCGDIDHKIGQELGLAIIPPLLENGTFDEGFGDFTGQEAIDPKTANLVFEKLREKHLLVAIEDYPHIYPHCWRTGDELVFRLVDEWFINMDWRQEIMDVTKAITWKPESIDGQNREVEWLTNMRDWMISKKRFWGLALPIWVNPDDPTDFEVIGSLKELKDRAVEGWDEFAGHTPHRPWIDKVKIKSEKTGDTLTRIPDVGNPWLDAGIVPFSTMMYNTNRKEWVKWYPADFVTECFPGQFRNWFYAMLALSTMMLYDDPERKDQMEIKRPFKTLFGHRFVMNEQGEPMSKSKGTAIWFEEAAEQLGVDTLRWMYLAQNPAVDLRFGLRHPDEPVTLETPEGFIAQTKEGLPTCKVTSGPADEVRRQILIPLWNSYAFFVNYAQLDKFDPTTKRIHLEQRPEIDRWILSNLNVLIEESRAAFEDFASDKVCAGIGDFVDDLSNWYIRRNRRRFWRSQDASDRDKLAAYQTLHEVLVTLTKLIAPLVPFVAERMYQNLVRSWDKAAPESVHLCDYPMPNREEINYQLNRRTATAQTVVRMALKLREDSNLRVRQPLAELQFACDSTELSQAIESLSDVIRDELNVKKLTGRENLDDLVHYSFKPNLKTLGPKYGKLLGTIKQHLPNVEAATLAPLRKGEAVTLTLAGESLTLAPEDVLVSVEQASDWVTAGESGIQIALSTTLTAELKREGMARDFVRQVQQLRKEANLEIQDRIRIFYASDDKELETALAEWKDYICTETLADGIEKSKGIPPGVKQCTVGTVKIYLWIEKVRK